MKRKIILKALLIVTLSFITVILSVKYLKGLNDYVYVYVASENIEAHELIKPTMIERVEIRFDEKVKFFSDAIDDESQIINSIALVTITKDQVITRKDMLLNTEENPEALINGKVNKNYFIESDQRIGFLSLDKNHAFGGDIKKGDYIDIVYTSQNDDTGGLYTSLLLQNVLVNKANVNSNTSTIWDIYLELNHKEAMLLSLAKYNGQLDILLSDESNTDNDIIPIIPPDLYEKLINAGYMLVDENSHKINGGSDSGEQTDLEKQMYEAEKQLMEAFDALNNAKEALSAELAKESTLSVEELIANIEKSVKELEISVEDNKSILEGLEVQFNEQMKGRE